MSQRFITTRQARVALDNMDEYAKMANIDPEGPHGVLSQFIEQVERAEAAQMAIPVYEEDHTWPPDISDVKLTQH